MLFPAVCRHVLLSFHAWLTDSLLVAGLGYLAAARAAFLKQLRKEVAIPVFVKDQFALGWCGVCLCVLYLEKSGSGLIGTADFHDRQIGIVEQVDAVLACRKFHVARIELEWDVDFDVVNVCVLLGMIVSAKALNNGSEYWLVTLRPAWSCWWFQRT